VLQAYVLYRFLKTVFASAFVLSLILLSLQLARLGSVLFGLPPADALGFLLVWSTFYTYFFLTEGVIVATASLLFFFKEKRLLHVFYAFRLSNARIFTFFAVPFLLVWLLSAGLSGVLLEEKVAFVRKNLLLKYTERLFRELPPGQFIRVGKLVLHAKEREGNELRFVFFKTEGLTVTARRLRYEGSGRFRFFDGHILTEENGRYFLVAFAEYELNARQFERKKLRAKRVRESKAVNYANALSMPFFFAAAFWLCLKGCTRLTHAYALTAVLIVLHQLLVFTVKLLL